MKHAHRLLFIFFLVATISAKAQVGIGTFIYPPLAASAQLDVSSRSQGFLPPRMTERQRELIIDPADGLIIWCTNCGNAGELQVFSAWRWTNVVGGFPSPGLPVVGDSYGGGIVAYVLQPGEPGYVKNQAHGLIAAASDQSAFAGWGCNNTSISGADGTLMGTGSKNTTDIISICAALGIAARLCGDLVLNGYNDWFLPSKDELNKLYLNKTVIGGFSANGYWSSSEFNSSSAWYQLFGSGTPTNDSKDNGFNVRAVRAF